MLEPSGRASFNPKVYQNASSTANSLLCFPALAFSLKALCVVATWTTWTTWTTLLSTWLTTLLTTASLLAKTRLTKALPWNALNGFLWTVLRGAPLVWCVFLKTKKSQKLLIEYGLETGPRNSVWTHANECNTPPTKDPVGWFIAHRFCTPVQHVSVPKRLHGS